MTTTLVIGGAASGKSEFAESLCLECAGPRVYVATMDAAGDAGTRRVARHRALREGKGFRTLERTRGIEALAPRVPHGCALLLEDVGNLVANELFAPDSPCAGNADAAAEAAMRGIEALVAAAGDAVVVTVDVFRDGVRYDEGTERWRQAVAQVNTRVAERADQVVEVVCGIPVWAKGKGAKR